MNTAVICIGNSDDKLTQAEWSEYVKDVDTFIDRWRFNVYFRGFPGSAERWQNACWVLDARDLFGEPAGQALDILRSELGRIAKKYKQDSIALILGDSKMVEPVG
jgi:hypothetical protein